MADEKYHRTFVHERNRYVPPPRAAFDPQFRGVLRSQGHPTVANSRPYAIKAQVLGPMGLESKSINIYEKPDQDFRSVATDWEQKNSLLCGTSTKFGPIVDSSTMVVAHYGAVSGDKLIGPTVEPGPDGIVKSTPEEYVAADIAVFIWDYAVFNPIPGEFGQYNFAQVGVPPGWARLGYPHTSYGVVVLPNGEVVHAVLLENNNGAALPTWSPLDLFTPARLGVNAAARLTGKIVEGAARRAYRALSGPTNALAARIRARLAAKQLPRAVVIKEGVRVHSKETAKQLKEKMERELDKIAAITQRALKEETLHGMEPWQQWTMGLTDELLGKTHPWSKFQSHIKDYVNPSSNPALERSFAHVMGPTVEQARLVASYGGGYYKMLSPAGKDVLRKLQTHLRLTRPTGP